MEESKKKPKIPSNYVSLLQRREWWLQQQQKQQPQPQHIEERDTQKEVMIDEEQKEEEEKQIHIPQQRQPQPQQQQQEEEEELAKRNEEEETESVTVSVEDDGGESSVTAKEGGNKKGRKLKKNKKKGKKEEEEVKEIEIRANKVEEENEERAAARERQVRRADFVKKGEKERVVLRRDGRKREARVEFRPKIEGKSDDLVGVSGQEVEDEKVDRRHVRVGNVVRRGKERVVSRRDGRKRQHEFRPKARNLAEGGHCDEVIQRKPDNVVEESGQEAEVERHLEDEKVRIDSEEDGVVEESNLTVEVERKLGRVSVDDESGRHVGLACVVKGKKERVASQRNWWKRGTRFMSRPKVTDLVEGSNCDGEIERKLDNLVQESGQEVDVERNVEDEKVGIKCEEDGVVDESELTGEVERKLGGVSVDKEREWPGRLNGQRTFRVGYKEYGGNNRGYRGSQGRFNRGNRGYHGYDWDDNRRDVHNLGGNGGPSRGGDGRGDNGGMVWVKKEEAAIVGNVT